MNTNLAKYSKKFIYQDYVWRIDNSDQLNKYIDQKVEELKRVYDNREEEKAFKIELIKEFFDIYKYDCENSIMPNGFLEEDKEKKILELDMIFILGSIFLENHTDIVVHKKKYPIVRFPSNVIDYNEMYYDGLNTYFLKLLGVNNAEVLQLDNLIHMGMSEEQRRFRKLSHVHCLFTSYAMLPLIETTLYNRVGITLIQQSFEILYKRINNKEINLELEEIKLLEKFKMNSNGVVGSNVSKEEIEKLYDILTKNEIIKESNFNREIFTKHKYSKDGKQKGRITLGDILKNEYLTEICEEEYLVLLRKLFMSSQMNFRNLVLHGEEANYDYFNIGFTAILVQLLWDILSGDMFKIEVKII